MKALPTKFLIILFLSCFFVGCRKGEYYDTAYYENEGIYLVRYIDGFGVGGEVMYYYITDSVNFTEYIGSADEKEYYTLTFNNNEATFEKYSRRNRGEQKALLINSEIYNINELKKKGHFDK